MKDGKKWSKVWLQYLLHICAGDLDILGREVMER